MCEKQCRDENGFKCHCASEAHQRQMSIFAENPDRYIEQFSQEFEDAFLSILSRRYGTKKVLANQVYQEIVSDRQHLHMNATKWDTLSEFVMHLGRSGKCKVEEAERGWLVEWIDTSPEALARRAATQKKERQEMDDEQREQMLLQEQLAYMQELKREKSEVGGEHDTPAEAVQNPKATALKRDDQSQPIVLTWKTPAQKKLGPAKSRGLAMTPKTPIVRKNAFKAAGSNLSKAKPSTNTTNTTNTTAGGLQRRPETAMVQIMKDELMRKESWRPVDARASRSTGNADRRRSRSPEPYGRPRYDSIQKHDTRPMRGRSRSPL
ncbi:hypothetical protein IW140_001897 [Coemansia sp. RSA 1813]|nr:hypothetical protein EV178_005065 [Coemansia sp. RSA 1646]KAJ2212081.1 hypothetical protein EV179_004943 [Coemansia sp. RSA 487]KAJ2570943.1 hypothetical protein IW140_001897 [Coemansia sp. RSA 1813]